MIGGLLCIYISIQIHSAVTILCITMISLTPIAKGFLEDNLQISAYQLSYNETPRNHSALAQIFPLSLSICSSSAFNSASI